MRCKKGKPIKEATEKELLRWHMEKTAEQLHDENIGECSNAFANLYTSFKNTHAIRMVLFVVVLQFLINNFVLIL